MANLCGGGGKPKAEGDEHGEEHGAEEATSSAQSGSSLEDEHGEEHSEEHGAEEATSSAQSGSSLPWWLIIPGGGGVAAIAASAFWLGRRTKPRLVPAYEGAEETLPATYLPNGSAAQGEFDQTHKAPSGVENNHHEPSSPT